MTLAASPELERLEAARADVDRANALLNSPSVENVARCEALLESACSALEGIRSWAAVARGTPRAIGQAQNLQQAIRRAARALQIARDYHTQWCRTWALQTSGYSPQGEGPPPMRRGLLSLSG
ncbi:MAG TPA: hypothetical protein VMH81_12710 [Bryobacteraceae bacterium]|nr:hypothetical protein [Bryobacteraceae bacterium]